MNKQEAVEIVKEIATSIELTKQGVKALQFLLTLAETPSELPPKKEIDWKAGRTIRINSIEEAQGWNNLHDIASQIITSLKAELVELKESCKVKFGVWLCPGCGKGTLVGHKCYSCLENELGDKDKRIAMLLNILDFKDNLLIVKEARFNELSKNGLVKKVLDLQSQLAKAKEVRAETCGISVKDDSRTYGCPHCGRPVRKEEPKQIVSVEELKISIRNIQHKRMAGTSDSNTKLIIAWDFEIAQAISKLQLPKSSINSELVEVLKDVLIQYNALDSEGYDFREDILKIKKVLTKIEGEKI